MKESGPVRDTHFLESASGGTSEDTERRRASERGALTSWKTQKEGQLRTRRVSERARGTHVLETHREGQVRTRTESERAGGTHFLESASGGTRDDTKRKPASERHSLSGEYSGWNK